MRASRLVPPPAAAAATGSRGRERGEGATVELLVQPLELDADPLALLAALRGAELPFALAGRWAGGGALLGAFPREVLPAGADPFAALDRLPEVTGAERAPAGAVGGGWFGWFGYGLGARIEELPQRPPRPVPVADSHLAFYDHVVRRDPGGRWWLEGLAPQGSGRAEFELRMAATSARLLQVVEQKPPELPELAFSVAAPGHEGHRRAVARAVERIAAGDLFQVNLGLRLEARAPLDPLDLFIRCAPATSPAYGAVFATPEGGVVSLSPELFLRREGRRISTGPIKGTVARPGGDAEAAERDRLLASPKDAAEHVMIVDLMRNDLGRVCEFGSVTREQRRRIEPHPGVWHLVSDVSGDLRPACGDGDVLRATFPPGSVTGAPKVQAMRMIADLEGTGRELYTGALGYVSPVGGLELSVAIRTFELSGDRIWLGAGGGVVADSRPEAELAEALAKAAPLVRAAGGRIVAEPATSRRGPALAGIGIAPAGLRPDPGRGLIETVAIAAEGDLVALDEHLARLAASVRALYRADLPVDLSQRAVARAAGCGPGRLRLVVVPHGEGVDVELQVAPLPAGAGPLRLVPFVLPGGLGPHKWRDRRLLDELSARAAGGVPLLVDGSGEVLEAAWANVWVVRDGIHATPPADGRILAGVTRSRRLRALRRAGTPVEVRALGLEELASGSVYLTSSLRDGFSATLP